MMPADIALAVTLASDGEPPSEFRIFTKGEVRTRKGAFVFDDKAAEAVSLEAGEFGNEFPLDYAHSMFNGIALNPAEAGKAAGWFRPEVRDGELWATDVTWTPDATRYLKNREYRYISPTFEHKERRITRLLNVALTNIPASHKLQPLMAHGLDDEPARALERAALEALKAQLSLPLRATGAAVSAKGEMDMKQVALMLGLSSEAAESEVLSRVTLFREITTEIVKLTGKDNPKEALGTVIAWKEETSKLEAAHARVQELEQSVLRREVEERVEGKIREGFLPPAQREFAVKLGMRDTEMFDAFLEGLKTRVVNRTGVEEASSVPRKPHPRIEVPSDAELARLGMTAEKWVATQTKMIEQGVL